MLHVQSQHALRRSRDGSGARWCLLCRGLSLGLRITTHWNDRPEQPWCCWGLFRALVAAFAITTVVLAGGGTTIAQESLKLNAATTVNAATSAGHTSILPISESQARASVQWLAELALRKSPRTYSGDKDWGETKKVWAGVKLRREGLQLKTKRRFKELRHGRWIKYELTLPPPSAPDSDQSGSVTAKIHRVRRTGDLQPGVPPVSQTNTHWQIDASIRAPMEFTARIERWNRGVQWYSIGIKGTMQVRMDTSSSLQFFADYTEVPPALVIAPSVTTAHLDLEEFEVDRVSKIGGDVAEEWGEMMEKVVRDVFLRKQNEKLARKLNQSITKHEDDLRLSLADWFNKW